MENTFIYDKPVTGRNFVGRKNDFSTLRQSLLEGKNVVLYETPKSGISSLINQALLELKLTENHFNVVEISLIDVRSFNDLLVKIATAFIGANCSTPEEHEAMAGFYLEKSHLKFDAKAFATKSGSFIRVTGKSSEKDLEELLAMPYRLAADRGERIIVHIEHFYNMLEVENPLKVLKDFESVIESQGAEVRCSWIWTGNRVNAMKTIFEEYRFFGRVAERIKLSPYSNKEISGFVSKSFLSNGKVIEGEDIEWMQSILKNNIWYTQHFCAICDNLSRGYIVAPIVKESIESLISIHEAKFTGMMCDLTTYQIQLLKAILEGNTRFSSADVIERYGLNSSANVRRLKDALCRKEIVTFEKKDKAVILDPLFEYWLKKKYFNF